MAKVEKSLSGQLIFFSVLFLVCIIFIVSSFSLSPISRRFPLAITALTAVLIAIRLAGLGRKYAKQKKAGGPAEKVKPFPWRDYGVVMLWVALLIAGMFIFGFVVACVVWSFFVSWYWGKQPVKSALVTTLVVAFLVYGLFGVLMRFPLYGGLLGIRIPFILTQ